jgi:Icc-related predicted phosphoesterase
MVKVRFLFSTDLHGSEVVWRKFLNSAKIFDLDALVISGDMTGKLIIPIFNQPDGTYKSTLFGEESILRESDLPEYEKKIRKLSYLPYRTTQEEAAKIAEDEDLREKVFERLQISVIKEWLSLVPQKVPEKCRVILTPGNDDVFAIDDVIRSDPNVTYGEEEVVSLDNEHEAACCGWSNPTPWHTPRECSEEELLQKLERTVAKVKNLETAVFCFHCPPYDSQIDLAPKLTEDLRPVYAHGKPLMIPVGCKSVRAVIEKYQPLLGLHGHIHESSGYLKIGRTQCVNPGSEYGEGILRAYLVELNGPKITRLQRVEG